MAGPQKKKTEERKGKKMIKQAAYRLFPQRVYGCGIFLAFYIAGMALKNYMDYSVAYTKITRETGTRDESNRGLSDSRLIEPVDWNGGKKDHK